MRAEAKHPRRVWPWIAIGALLIVALVTAVAVIGNNPARAPLATTTPANTSGTPTPQEAEPTGCLGGTARDAVMVIRAVNTAGPQKIGAVEVAASFTRWIQRYPYPSATEATEVGSSVLAKKSFTSDLAEYLAAKPDLSGGIVPIGTTYYMNTVPGVWYVESADSDRVTVSIGSGYVIDGALSSTLRSSITITLVRESNQWRVANADGTRTPSDLYRLGHPFDGGC